MSETAAVEQQEKRALTRAEQFQQWVQAKTTDVVAALPLSVPDAELKRARARLRVALSEDSVGKLYECTPESVGRALVLSAISGLMPGGPSPDVWLIARRNKHKGNALECNWQISFRGYIRLARRVNWDLEPVLVFAGDDFDYEEGSEPRVRHKPNLDTPQTWENLRLGYVRVFPGDRRYTKLALLTKDRIIQRRQRAQDQGIWNQWPLEQALKTLCHFAGAREMFPCDDPTRYAIAADMEAEAGGAELELPKRRSVTPGATLTSLRELAAGRETVEVELPVEPEMEDGAPAAETGDAETPQVEDGPAPEVEPPPAPDTLGPEARQRIATAVEARGYSVAHLEATMGRTLDQVPASGEMDVLKRVQQLPDLTKRKGGR